MELPMSGTVFISVKKKDRKHLGKMAKEFNKFGFNIIATDGTAEEIRNNGVDATIVKKISEGLKGSILEEIQKGNVDLIVNTSSGSKAKSDGYYIRRAAVEFNIPYITTIQGALSTIKAIKSIKEGDLGVYSLNDLENK
jgi:carbamoyl-phosphate synthase large subunit